MPRRTLTPGPALDFAPGVVAGHGCRTTITKPLARVVLATLALGGWCAVAHAAPVVWGTPQTISGESDVSTAGSLLYAYNVGQSTVAAATVNGVLFSAYPFPIGASSQTVTVGNVTMTESPDFLVGYFVGSSASPYAGLSATYKGLLDEGGGAGFPDAMTMTFGGLSPGQQYLFQWWASNARNTPVVNTATATATNSVTLDTNLTDTDGGLGQFVTGTFTADGTTQEIVLTGVGIANPIINAFQIRAVPEPSTCVMALTGLACGGYSMWRRRTERTWPRRKRSSPCRSGRWPTASGSWPGR